MYMYIPLYYCMQDLKEAAFYSDEDHSSGEESDEEDSEDDEEGEETKKKKKKPKKKLYVMDSDHRLLLKNSKPLLQSRNAAVSGCGWMWWVWVWVYTIEFRCTSLYLSLHLWVQFVQLFWMDSLRVQLQKL